MNDEHRKIIIRKISSYEQQGTDPQDTPPASPINRWVALIIMIPVLALLAVLGVFFFTIFVALFSIIAAVIGLRIWWLRRKFRRNLQETSAMPDDRQQGYNAQTDQYNRTDSVEDAEIIEETTIIKESRKSPGNKKQ
jgi:predicted lipid-binding transport protein (Tim44 family)